MSAQQIEEGVYLGTDPADRSLQLHVPERQRIHQVNVGASGGGKTKQMQDQILQDVMAGRGCAVIDPKGDLIFDLLASLSSLDERFWPGLAERVVLIDPAEPATALGINPLELRHGTSPGRQRQSVHAALRRLWDLDAASGPRLDFVLRKILQLLMETGGTLGDVPRLLRDDAYRESLVSRVDDEELRYFFREQLPTGAAGLQWTMSIQTRIGSLLDDPSVRKMLSSPRSDIDFRDAMDDPRGKLVLISLSRGRISDSTASVLGGLFTVLLQLAAESRQHIWPPERRRKFYIYADEFSGMLAASSLRELFSEGRGYGVSLVVANQTLSQIDSELRASVFSSARIRLIFRVNAEDARLLANELHFQGDRVKSRELQWIRLGKVWLPVGFKYDYLSASEEERQNRQWLHGLSDRHFWVHLADTGTLVKLRSVDIPPVDRVVAEGRIARFKAMLHRSSPLPAPRSLPLLATRPLPRLVAPAPARRTFDWLPPDGDA